MMVYGRLKRLNFYSLVYKYIGPVNVVTKLNTDSNTQNIFLHNKIIKSKYIYNNITTRLTLIFSRNILKL